MHRGFTNSAMNIYSIRNYNIGNGFLEMVINVVSHTTVLYGKYIYTKLSCEGVQLQ